MEQVSLTSSSYSDGDGESPERVNNSVLRPYALSRKALLAYDVHFNGELQQSERVRFAGASALVLLLGASIIYLLAHALPSNGPCDEADSPEADSSEADSSDSAVCDKTDLLWNVLLLSVLFILVGLGAGLVAVKTSLNVGYTRKSLHFASFFLPFAVNVALPTQSHYSITMFKFWIILLVYLLATKPARRLFYPSLLMFRAIDRPSDRPRTLQWMVTQFLLSSAVVVALKAYWESIEGLDSDHLLMILVLVNGLGDGLAEPVGVKFGKHKYTARTLVYEGELFKQSDEGLELCNGVLRCSNAFTRSLEGSSMVFLVSLVSVLAFYASFDSALQVMLAALLLPPIMTVTEAFSPHTLDSPFLFLVGGLLLSVVIEV